MKSIQVKAVLNTSCMSLQTTVKKGTRCKRAPAWGGGKQTMWEIPIDIKTGKPKTWNQLAEEGYVKITVKEAPSGKYSTLINTVIE